MGRPAAHIAGPSLSTKGIGGRWVELLREAKPDVRCIAVLANPSHAQRDGWVKDIIATAMGSGIEVEIHDVGDAAALARTLERLEHSSAEGLIVTGDPVFLGNRDKIIAFAEKRRMPAVYFSKLFVVSGGLLAYGGSLEDSYRRAAGYVDRILKGARPAELPVEPTAVELAVNLRTAKAIGLPMPQSLVKRADKVIE